jgi:hypothetical protein
MKKGIFVIPLLVNYEVCKKFFQQKSTFSKNLLIDLSMIMLYYVEKRLSMSEYLVMFLYLQYCLFILYGLY